jgi:hypothetical protein
MLETIILFALIGVAALGVLTIAGLVIAFLNLPEDSCCNGECKHND